MSCGSDLLFGFLTLGQQPCTEIFGIVSTRALYQQPNQGLYQGLQMSQSRFGIRMSGSKTMIRFAMNGIRSAGQSSYMGIDGESLLWQIQLAEMMLRNTLMTLVTGSKTVNLIETHIGDWISTFETRLNTAKSVKKFKKS